MIKICNVIDEYTREHVGFAIDHRLATAAVSELRDLASLENGGRPWVICMDNGSEFSSSTLRDWACEDETLQAFIPP
ncbi:DDE-type integrase/transposase/recombinase [Boudabousia marimammalium]|uniref:DDE-type integrase/transposase/recombinase n=1 Tax=Boudabousia marimammalium TaxID=156892 RepID=UPI003CCBBCA3